MIFFCQLMIQWNILIFFSVKSTFLQWFHEFFRCKQNTGNLFSLWSNWWRRWNNTYIYKVKKRIPVLFREINRPAFCLLFSNGGFTSFLVDVKNGSDLDVFVGDWCVVVYFENSINIKIINVLVLFIFLNLSDISTCFSVLFKGTMAWFTIQPSWKMFSQVGKSLVPCLYVCM